jgi:hypothetical protein
MHAEDPYYDKSTPVMSNYRTVNISDLVPGDVLAGAIFDEKLKKLVDAGVALDEKLIERLKSHGVTEVVVESSADTIIKHALQPSPTVPNPRLKSARVSKPVERCSVCGSGIEMQPPAPAHNVTAWICENCGAIYFGSDDVTQKRPGMYRVDPAVRDPFSPSTPSSIPIENARRLVTHLGSDQFIGPDCRGHKRYLVTVPVIALPLAEDFRVDGEAIQMTTANISRGGAALIHTRYVKAPYLALDFTVAGLESLQVVLSVLRVRSLGPLYEVSGEFISRLVSSLQN